MEITRREIKKRAIIGLKGDFLKSVFAVFLSVFVIFLYKFLVVGAGQILPIYEKNLQLPFFILSSFLWGIGPGTVLFFVFRWYYRKISMAELQNRPSAVKAFAVNTLMIIKLQASGFIFLLPAAALHFMTLALKYGIFTEANDMLLLALDILTVFLILLGLLFLLFFMMRYFLCWFILSENPSIKIGTAIKLSVKMMKNEKGDAFCFILSLLPLLFFCLLILPAFYFLPKMLSSVCLYGKYIIEKNRISFPMLSYK